MTRFVTLAAALALGLPLGACATTKGKAPEATGAYRPLNAGRWRPTRDDLRGPRAPLPPSQSWSLKPQQGQS
jgi:hypothetical protein